MLQDLKGGPALVLFLMHHDKTVHVDPTHHMGPPLGMAIGREAQEVLHSVQFVSPEGSPQGTFPLLNILLELRKVHRAILIDIILPEQVVEVVLGAWELHPLQRSLHERGIMHISGDCTHGCQYDKVDLHRYLELSPIEVAILVPVEFLEKVLDVQRILGCSYPSPCHPLTHGVQGPQLALVLDRQSLAAQWHV